MWSLQGIDARHSGHFAYGSLPSFHLHPGAAHITKLQATNRQEVVTWLKTLGALNASPQSNVLDNHLPPFTTEELAEIANSVWPGKVRQSGPTPLPPAVHAAAAVTPPVAMVAPVPVVAPEAATPPVVPSVQTPLARPQVTGTSTVR